MPLAVARMERGRAQAERARARLGMARVVATAAKGRAAAMTGRVAAMTGRVAGTGLAAAPPKSGWQSTGWCPSRVPWHPRPCMCPAPDHPTLPPGPPRRAQLPRVSRAERCVDMSRLRFPSLTTAPPRWYKTTPFVGLAAPSARCQPTRPRPVLSPGGSRHPPCHGPSSGRSQARRSRLRSSHCPPSSADVRQPPRRRGGGGACACLSSHQPPQKMARVPGCSDPTTR